METSTGFGSLGKSRSIWGVSRADWICIGILLILTLGFFWKGLIDPKEIIKEDASSQYQPYYTFVADEITSGRFPHWNPYISCGVPFHAALQGAVLYPLRLPLNWVSFPVGYLLTVLVHFFLAGVFMHAFCRITLKCSALPSLIAGVSFAFGGFTLGHITHPNWIQAYPWMILTIFLICQSMEKSSLVWAVSAAIPIALIALACAVHILMVLGMGLGIWAIGETIIRIVRRIRGERRSLLWIAHPMLALAIAVLLGSAMAMAQLLPGMFQSARSLRTEVDWEFITAICSHPARAALRLIVPFYYGNYRIGYWGEVNFHALCFYAGIVPLTAAIIAVGLCWKNPLVRRLVVFVIIIAAIAAGRFLPFYRLLYDYVPFCNSLRNPSRFFILVQFAITCLGAIGLERALQIGRRQLGRPGIIFSLIVGAGLLIVMIVSLFQIHNLIDDPSPGLKFIRGMDRFTETDSRRAIQALKSMPQRIFQDYDSVTWIAAITGIVSACTCGLFFAIGRLRVGAVGWILLALLIVDLGMFSGGMLHYTQVGEDRISAVVTETPPHTRFLQKHLGLQRFVCWGWYRTNLDRFRGMQFRIRHIMINRGGTFHSSRQWKMILAAWSRNRRIGNLLGVRQIVTNRPIKGPNLKASYWNNPVFLTENQDAFPLAFLAPRVRVFDDPNAMFAELAAGRENLRDVALLEDQVEPLRGSNGKSQQRGEILDIQDVPGRYLMRTKTSHPQQLVLTETYHPQWKCTIDGTEVQVYLTNYAFMSVRVPPGMHQVKWWFEPTRFKQGLAITVGSSAITLVLLVLGYFRRRRHQRTKN